MLNGAGGGGAPFGMFRVTFLAPPGNLAAPGPDAGLPPGCRPAPPCYDGGHGKQSMKHRPSITRRLSSVCGVLWLLLAVIAIAGAQAAPATRPAPAAAPLAAPPAPAALAPDAAAQPLQPPHDKAALLRVSGEIDDVLFNSLKWRVDAARKAGCTLIILDIDSAGGAARPTLDVSRFIRASDIPIVAWVHPSAYSGAAVIALACSQVVMAPNGFMGDCEPLVITDGELKPAPDNAFLVDDLDASAAKNGFKAALARAMVRRELVVYELRNVDTGEFRYVVEPRERDRLLAVVRQAAPGQARQAAEPLWKLTSPPIDTEKTVLTAGTDLAIKMGLAKHAPTTDGAVANIDQLRAAMNIRGELLRMGYPAAANVAGRLIAASGPAPGTGAPPGAPVVVPPGPAAPDVPAVAPAAPALAPDAAAQPLQPPHDKAALLRVSGEIDDVLFNSLKWRVDAARKAGCTLIILDVDSTGGLVVSALAMSKYIKNSDIPIVAWINPTAYSGAAIVSLACSQIVMARSATIGDSLPIMVDNGRPAAIPAELLPKVESPIVEDLDDSARRNGFDPYLARAMVIRELTVYELRNVRTGAVRYVGPQERDRLLAEVASAPADLANHPVEHPWKLTDTVKDDHSMLTVGTEQAIAMGFAKRAPTADGSVNTIEQLRAVMNIRGQLLRMDSTWAEDLTRWLTNWWIRFVIFVLMLVLAGIEFSHPGVSLPGVGALLCLAVLVGAAYLTGVAQAWEIILIVAGVAFIVVDLAIYGGIGLLAVPGFILMALGLVASFVPADPSGSILPTTVQAYTGLRNGLTVVVFGSILALAALFTLSRFFHLTPGFRRLQLAPVAAQPSAVVQDAAQTAASDVVFLGSIGQAQSALRPAGKALFDRHLIDVVTQGDYIVAGTTVVVVEIAGQRVVVRAHKPA